MVHVWTCFIWLHRAVETWNGLSKSSVWRIVLTLVQFGGHVTNQEDPYTAVSDRGGMVTSVAVAEEWF